MTIRLLAAALFLATSAFLAAAEEPRVLLPEGKKATDADVAVAPLEGGYTIVSGEKDGKPIPEGRIKGSVVRFTADRITGTDKDKKEFFAATYTLDTTKKPWVIRMKTAGPKGAEAVGLVKKDGDALTIVYSLPDANAPTEFRTQNHQHLFVMKAIKAAPDKKPSDKLQKGPDK